MRKTWQRVLGFAVSASMVAGLVPAQALAEVVTDLSRDSADDSALILVQDANEYVELGQNESAPVDLGEPSEAAKKSDASESTEAATELGQPLAPQVDSYDIGDDSWGWSWKGNPNVLSVDKLPAIEFIRWDDDVQEDTVLQQNTNFVLDHYEDTDGNVVENPTQIGSYWAVYTGVAPYMGTRSVDFAIADVLDLQYAQLEVANQNLYLYPGETVSLSGKVTVTDPEDNVLEEGVDYELVYFQWVDDDEGGDYKEIGSALTGFGEFHVSARAKAGNPTGYTGTTGQEYCQVHDLYDLEGYNSITWSSSGSDVSNVSELDGCSLSIYDWVTDETLNTLTQGKDFVVDHIEDMDGNQLQNPTEPGSYMVVFRGVSPYKGTNSWEFRIHDYRDLSVARLGLTNNRVERTGEPVDLSELVEVTDAEDNKLAYGTDYELAYYIYNVYNADEGEYEQLAQPPVDEGTYYVVARAKDGNASGYTGETEQWQGEFTIYDNSDISLHDWYFLGSRNFAYTGNPVTLPELLDNGLVEGTDFRFSHYEQQNGHGEWVKCDSTPVDVGTYRVVYEGIGSYHGQGGPTFLIVDSFDISSEGFDANLLGYAYYDYESNMPVCLLGGAGARPELRIYNPDYDMLLEGTDYTVEYQQNTVVGQAKVVAKGTGSYTGELTRDFLVVESLDMWSYFDYQGCAISLGSAERSFYEGSDTLEFLYTGSEAKPRVVCYGSYGSSDAATIKEGVDYTLTCKNANGDAVEYIKDPGDYIVVLTATDGGVFATGSIAIPLRVVSTVSMTETYPSLRYDGSYSSMYDSAWGTVYTINDLVDDVSNLAWSVSSSFGMLVENLHYTVSHAIDDATKAITYTFTGIGGFTGTTQRRLYVASTAEESLGSRNTWNLYGQSNRNIAYVNEDGTLQDAQIMVDGLTQNVDYTFQGYEDADGKAITKAEIGSTVYAVLGGAGLYAGARRTVAQVVYPGSAKRVAENANIIKQLKNGVTSNANGREQRFLLRGTSPEVGLVVYGRTRLTLAPGQGFSVSTTVDGDVMHVTTTADAGGFLSDAARMAEAMDITLVDSYGIDQLTTYVRAYDTCGNTDTCAVANPSTLQLSYAGISYVPRVELLAYYGGVMDQPDFDVALLNGKGAKVDAITGAGSYSLVVTGKGDWSGKVTVPLEVGTQDRIDLSLLDVRLGDNTQLQGGKAEPTVTVSRAGHEFVRGTDYQLEYFKNTEAGSKAYVKVTAKQGSKLYGEQVKQFVVTGEPGTKLSRGDWELSLQNPLDGGYYTPSSGGVKAHSLDIGSNKGPAVKVTSKSTGKVLDAGNYEVAYGNLKDGCLGTVTVTGKGGYSGSLSANFFVIAKEGEDPAPPTFSDVSEKTAHSDDISWLAETGISKGWTMKDGTVQFRPLANVARADMAAFLFRLAKGWGLVGEDWQPTGSASFSDVTDKTAHYREIMWLAETGISKGWTMKDGTVQFRPLANVARADMAAFLARLAKAAGIGGLSASASTATDAAAFIDVTDKTAHAEDIAWLAASGISKGWTTPKGAEFRPLANVARADMAAFLHRLDGIK